MFAAAFVAYNELSKNYEPESVALQTQNADDAGETKQSKKSAPDFTVLNKYGDEVSLSDYKGKPVVINFWTTWCPPCKSELPYFDKLYNEYKDTVEFMMVNLTDNQNETVDVVNKFIKDEGYTFPVYYDINSDAATAYATYSIPITVFVDSEGNIYHKQVGAMSESTLRGYVENLK